MKETLRKKLEGYEKVVSLKETILSLEEQLEEVRRNRVEVELRTRDLKTYGSMTITY